MKIAQNKLSYDWSGSHIRFTEEGEERVHNELCPWSGDQVPVAEFSLVPYYDEEMTIMERLGLAPTGTGSKNRGRFISEETIRACEELASGECPEKRASVFRKAIYVSPDYRENLGNMRRGNGAENWRDDGGTTFICVSLEEVNKVYVKLGRRDWYENGSKGKRKECPPELRCFVITVKGSQCTKKMCEGSQGMCTQHWKKFLRS
jgi:hypothetical protein